MNLCNKFREYCSPLPKADMPICPYINSAAGYWPTFRAVLHTAYHDHKIKENPNAFLERIDTIPKEKEHLSQQELIRLTQHPCKSSVLKQAFLFACPTALRKSDIKTLRWEEMQPYGMDGGIYITTRMQKTKEIIHNHIGEEALRLIDYQPDREGLVFPDFQDKLTQAPHATLAFCGRHHQAHHLPLHSPYPCLPADRCRHPNRGNAEIPRPQEH